MLYGASVLYRFFSRVERKHLAEVGKISIPSTEKIYALNPKRRQVAYLDDTVMVREKAGTVCKVIERSI